MIETRDPLSEINLLREENQKQQLQIQKLQQQLEQLLRIVYGKKTEKFIPSIPEQTVLALDIEAIVQPEVQKETITYDRKKSSGTSNHKGRLPVPDPAVQDFQSCNP